MKIIENFSKVLISFIDIDEIREQLLSFLKELNNKLSEYKSKQIREINKRIISITFFVEPNQGINMIEQKSEKYSEEFYEYYANIFNDVGQYNKPKNYDKVSEINRTLYLDVLEKNLYNIIDEAKARNIKIDNKEFIDRLGFLLFSYLKINKSDLYVKRVIDLSFEADKVCVWIDDFISGFEQDCTKIYDNAEETSKVYYLSALEKLANNILKKRKNALGRYFFTNIEKERKNNEILLIKKYLISLLLKEKIKEIEEKIKHGNLKYKKIYKNKKDQSIIKLLERLYKNLEKAEEKQDIFSNDKRKKETIFEDYKMLINIKLLIMGVNNNYNLHDFYNYYFNFNRAKEKRTESLKEFNYIKSENIEDSKKFTEFFDDKTNKRIKKLLDIYKTYNDILKEQKEISNLAKDIYGEGSKETIKEYSYLAILMTIFDEEGSLEIIENLIEISKIKKETNVELTKYLEHIQKCIEFILENSKIAYENFRLLNEDEINKIFLVE